MLLLLRSLGWKLLIWDKKTHSYLGCLTTGNHRLCFLLHKMRPVILALPSSQKSKNKARQWFGNYFGKDQSPFQM